MSSSRDLAAAIKKLKCFNFSPKMEIADFRKKIDNTLSSTFMPDYVQVQEKTWKSVSGYEIVPDVFASHRVMLYIHGGAFVAGSAKAYLSFASTLANATSARTVVPEFRLPPSHPFPAGIDDIKEVFRAIYTDESVAISMKNDGIISDEKRPEIIIAADDSGASLAMALLLELKGRFRDCIRQVFLFSPILNIADTNPLFTAKKAKDDIYTAEGLRHCAELYTYTENRTNPQVSPVYITTDQLENFPPVFIQTGEKDYLLDDSICLQSILKGSNVECTLDIVPEMIHLFQLDDDNLSEAHLSVERAGKLITHRKVTEQDSVFTASLVTEKSTYVPKDIGEL